MHGYANMIVNLQYGRSRFLYCFWGSVFCSHCFHQVTRVSKNALSETLELTSYDIEKTNGLFCDRNGATSIDTTFGFDGNATISGFLLVKKSNQTRIDSGKQHFPDVKSTLSALFLKQILVATLYQAN